MASKNVGGNDLSSVYLLGGLSVVVIGGLVYWFMNKAESEEKPVENVNLDELVNETKNVVEVINRIRKYSKFI